MSDTDTLKQFVEGMNRTRVLIIGDVMLDMYEHCEVKRISPEAPVPVARVTADSYYLGGAANVANNAAALGAKVSLVSVVGTDREADVLRALFNARGIDPSGLVAELGRITTLKKRVISGTHQLIRIDREEVTDITQETGDVVCGVLKEKIKEHDVIIISDYSKGLLTESLIGAIKEESEKWGKKVFVDSKNRRFLKYSNFYLIKPNKEEAEHFTGEKFANQYENLEIIGNKLRDIFKSNIVITLGGDGMALFEGDEFFHIKTRALEVFDVSGAGDTVISTIATAVASGAPLEDAIELANYAAGHVVSQLGTAVCSRDTLKQILDNQG